MCFGRGGENQNTKIVRQQKGKADQDAVGIKNLQAKSALGVVYTFVYFAYNIMLDVYMDIR